MLVKSFLAMAALATVGAAEPVRTGPGTPYYTGPAPARFNGPVAAVLIATDPLTVHNLCGGRSQPPGITVRACVTGRNKVPYLIMPHPAFVTPEQFALYFQHEAGHLRGWSGNHEL